MAAVAAAWSPPIGGEALAAGGLSGDTVPCDVRSGAVACGDKRWVRARLVAESVTPQAAQSTSAPGGSGGLLDDHAAARGVEQRGPAELINLSHIDEPTSGMRAIVYQRNMQGQRVAGRLKGLSERHGVGVASEVLITRRPRRVDGNHVGPQLPG